MRASLKVSTVVVVCLALIILAVPGLLGNFMDQRITRQFSQLCSFYQIQCKISDEQPGWFTSQRQYDIILDEKTFRSRTPLHIPLQMKMVIRHGLLIFQNQQGQLSWPHFGLSRLDIALNPGAQFATISKSFLHKEDLLTLHATYGLLGDLHFDYRSAALNKQQAALQLSWPGLQGKVDLNANYDNYTSQSTLQALYFKNRVGELNLGPIQEHSQFKKTDADLWLEGHAELQLADLKWHDLRQFSLDLKQLNIAMRSQVKQQHYTNSIKLNFEGLTVKDIVIGGSHIDLHFSSDDVKRIQDFAKFMKELQQKGPEAIAQSHQAMKQQLQNLWSAGGQFTLKGDLAWQDSHVTFDNSLALDKLPQDQPITGALLAQHLTAHINLAVPVEVTQWILTHFFHNQIRQQLMTKELQKNLVTAPPTSTNPSLSHQTMISIHQQALLQAKQLMHQTLIKAQTEGFIKLVDKQYLLKLDYEKGKLKHNDTPQKAQTKTTS